MLAAFAIAAVFFAAAAVTAAACAMFVLSTLERVTRDYAAERGRLLQRIQAPAQAVAEHATAAQPTVGPAAVGFDDDNGYWEAQALIDRITDGD